MQLSRKAKTAPYRKATSFLRLTAGKIARLAAGPRYAIHA
jgi:hypothetical protein